ncbi:MAG: hypothetical protein GEV03_25515 [Streptosporangiales bacterium]|nr:hypothetical protein [Streptosporangiales bacterium]
MANGLAFPEAEAQTIIEYARRTSAPAAEAIVDRVRDWLGHPETVTDRAEAWDPAAKRAIVDAKESIVACRGKLAEYWEGPAYDSFMAYLGSIEKAFDDAHDLMSGMSDLMENSRETVTETYRAAIQSIGDCAADILEAVGGIPGTTPDWLGILGEIARLLAKFVRSVTDLENQALGTITEYGETGLELQRKAADLKVPTRMPSSAGVADDWGVRRQP